MQERGVVDCQTAVMSRARSPVPIQGTPLGVETPTPSPFWFNSLSGAMIAW